MDSLQCTQLALLESQSHLDEVTVELERFKSTLAPNPVQLHSVVVGGEFTSTGRDDGCGHKANTSI